MFIPTNEQFFNNHGKDRSKPDIGFLKNHFHREGRISEEQALWIIETCAEVLKKESNVLQVDAPITGECCAPRRELGILFRWDWDMGLYLRRGTLGKGHRV